MESIAILIDVTDPGLQKVLLMALVGAVFYGGYALLGKAKEKTTEIKANISLKNNPNNVPSLINLGLQKMKLNEADSAIEHFEKALKNAPGNLDAYLYLGICHHFQKNYDTSEHHLAWTVKYLNSVGDDNKKGMDLAKKYGDNLGLVLYFYGHILHMQGDENSARLYKREALSVSKSFEDYQLY
jgi:tetratricopeptide (TPR) repeat protein